jgi:septal ring factor EnvC (AmiA/AmiB activator)
LKKHLDRILPRVDERRRVPAPTGPTQAELDAVVRRVWSTAYCEASRAEAQSFAARTAALEAQRSQLANELQAIRDDARKLERRIARAEAELRSMMRRLAGPPANRSSEPPKGNEPGRPTRPVECEVNR